MTWSFIHVYSKQKWQPQQTNVTPLKAILMAMQMHWNNTCSITQWSQSRATLDGPGCCDQSTTCSVWPQWLPRQQANKQGWKNTSTLLANLMATAICRYVTACMALLRRSRASLEATGCCHRASIYLDSSKGTYLHHFLGGVAIWHGNGFV